MKNKLLKNNNVLYLKIIFEFSTFFFYYYSVYNIKTPNLFLF